MTMFDPISPALTAAAAGSGAAIPLVLLAGALSSIGPCVAPRFIALGGLCAGRSRKDALGLSLCFVCGLACAYAAFGAIASLLIRAAAFSAFIYAALALVLGWSGLAALWRDGSCTHEQEKSGRTSAGGALLLGGSFALVVSPCCTPLIAAIAAYTSAAGNALYGSLLLACFALGHALPLLFVTCGASAVARLLSGQALRRAAAVVGASLMLGLAGYYAVLA